MSDETPDTDVDPIEVQAMALRAIHSISERQGQLSESTEAHLAGLVAIRCVITYLVSRRAAVDEEEILGLLDTVVDAAADAHNRDAIQRRARNFVDSVLRDAEALRRGVTPGRLESAG